MDVVTVSRMAYDTIGHIIAQSELQQIEILTMVSILKGQQGISKF